MARGYASKIQDFTKDYMDIAQKCQDFTKSLLDRCTTKHEVQTLLQTKSYAGHTDANFNIAILDGHKEFVAHEKFQQLLHKKWGQRDRNQVSEKLMKSLCLSKFRIIFWKIHELKSFLHVLFSVEIHSILQYILVRKKFLGQTCSHVPTDSRIFITSFCGASSDRLFEF